MIYTYYCRQCGYEFNSTRSVENRMAPTFDPCARCGVREVRKMMDAPNFKVKGACAANGYSDTVGDVEKFTGKPFEPDD